MIKSVPIPPHGIRFSPDGKEAYVDSTLVGIVVHMLLGAGLGMALTAAWRHKGPL